MSIALMVITDAEPNVGLDTPRLDYLKRTIDSAMKHLIGNITHQFIVVDCIGNSDYWSAVCEEANASGYVARLAFKRLGFSGAIQTGWDYVAQLPADVTHVFHLEGDFVFNQDIDLSEMETVLDEVPDLAQLALLRQPWSVQEVRAGGIIQVHPDDFELVTYEYPGWACGFSYVAHKKFFTTNPCLYRRELTTRGWPEPPESEDKFGISLVQDGYHFGFWQESLDAPPVVEHIGLVRTGKGY